MNRYERLSYKQAMVDLLSSMEGQFYHVTAMLHPSAPEASLENALRGWFARVDRFYLGRNWSRAGEDRADGIVFFETRPYAHAHIVMRPPVRASGLHFLQDAGFFFVRHPEREMRRLYPNPLTTSGKMLIQKIGEDRADLLRTTGYAAKEMEWRSDAPVRWKFVRGLEADGDNWKSPSDVRRASLSCEGGPSAFYRSD